jgi:hypothetical protein
MLLHFIYENFPQNTTDPTIVQSNRQILYNIRMHIIHIIHFEPISVEIKAEIAAIKKELL